SAHRLEDELAGGELEGQLPLVFLDLLLDELVGALVPGEHAREAIVDVEGDRVLEPAHVEHAELDQGLAQAHLLADDVVGGAREVVGGHEALLLEQLPQATLGDVRLDVDDRAPGEADAEALGSAQELEGPALAADVDLPQETGNDSLLYGSLHLAMIPGSIAPVPDGEVARRGISPAYFLRAGSSFSSSALKRCTSGRSFMVSTPGRAAITLGMAFTTMAAVAMSPATPPATVASIGGSPSTRTRSRGDSAPPSLRT